MISEPELEGEWEAGRPAGPAEPDAPREPVRGLRTAWLWALGGAVLASAVWAGLLAVQDRFADAPRIAYRQTEDLCKVPLPAVFRSTAVLAEGTSRHGEHPALDWSYCAHEASYVEGRTSYEVQVAVQLHKKTDPRPEFGAGPPSIGGIGGFGDMAGTGAAKEQVPGLGERALLHRWTGGTRLQVIDGGAVFTLSVHWFGESNDSRPDEDAVQAAMIEDMRALMAALHT
ncbi:hypothetical protein ABZZ20_04200 [Streptomyces sp. NPDC006430]|uniref:hypothetical protein n=1 Tax=Streptomyces sp. NPDC006430 TaxID=3154299 RepID=UPI0033A701CB